jgi:DUF2914 family protein
MKPITLTLALALVTAGAVAAQDTTRTPPQTPPPASMATGAPAPSSMTVEVILARNVLDRVPQDTGSAFPADVGQLTLWSRVSGGEGQQLHHVWFFGDTEVSDVTLNINGSPWRTWSRKTIPPEATGAWHVEVRDAAGNVLKRVDFTIQ